MYDCNKCENADSNVCLHCFTVTQEKPPYFKGIEKIDYENMLMERSEINVGKC